MYGKAAIDEMKALKRAIDPQWRLNRGTISKISHLCVLYALCVSTPIK
jgi:hypothetical protein